MSASSSNHSKTSLKTTQSSSMRIIQPSSSSSSSHEDHQENKSVSSSAPLMSSSPNNSINSIVVTYKPVMCGGPYEMLVNIVLDRLKTFSIDLEKIMLLGGYDLKSCSTNNTTTTSNEFLKRELNLSSLEFLIRIAEFNKMKDPLTRFQQSQMIIDAFFREESDSQINLNNNIREIVIAKFYNYASEEFVDPNLFDNAKVDVSIQLKSDNFLRFTQSKQFTDHIISVVTECLESAKDLEGFYHYLDIYLSMIGEKKNARMQDSSARNFIVDEENQPSSPPLATTSDTSSQNSDSASATSSDVKSSSSGSAIVERFARALLFADTTRKIVKEEDFEMLKVIIQSNDENLWKCITSSKDKDSTCFASYKSDLGKLKLDKKKRTIQLFKETGILNATPEEVLTALIDSRYYSMVENQIISTDFLEFIEDDEEEDGLGVSYSRSVVKMPWPLSNREFILGSSVRREIGIDSTESDFLILRRGIENSKVPITKGCVRGRYIGGILIEKLSDIHTRYTAMAFIDLGGIVPLSLWNKLTSMRGNQSFLGLKKAIEMSREAAKKRVVNLINMTTESFVVPTNTNRIADTIKLYDRRMSRAASPERRTISNLYFDADEINFM
ncbi:predicted protein [Naegleria gruberi]|uniref:Predicted protein n=1 Tax=Naegleria gruberi TaxID=5762 RepID=D2VW93_NAEGR|nr:uncharacterized protein NAEGRDRAFT_52759 [Naegleria gruberi]EFC38865.1 predicted protein [Naegleria gruberi]|eukprot:XP_002671609.1 predicted protein [Naegleria gruberi strain NEG-M]